jgi:hypothetical protein
MLFDNRFGNRQPKPGAMSLGLPSNIPTEEPLE